MGDFVPYDGPVIGASEGAKPPPGAGFMPYDGPVVGAPKGAAMVSPQNNQLAIGPGPRTSQMPDQPAPQSWGDVGRRFATNFLPSVGPAAEKIYDAFRHPLDTGGGLVKLGVGALENLPQPYQTPERQNAIALALPQQTQAREEAKAQAGNVGNYLSNRFGGIENIKETLASDPVGSMLDASSVLPVTDAVLPARAAAITRNVSPITAAGNVLKGGTKVADFAGANALGMTTGAGPRAIRDAGAAGRDLGSGVGKSEDVVNNAAALTDNMNRGAPVSSVVDRFKGALDEARSARGEAYRKGLADVGKDTAPLDFQPIEDAVNKASEVGTFKGVTVEPAAVGTIEKMRGIVDEWKGLDPAEYHTPLGIDALKRTLGNIRDATPYGSPERVAANRVYSGVRGALSKAAPDYDKVMGSYGTASEKIGEANKTFSLGENVSGDTAARKVLSAGNTGVGGSFLNRQRVLDELAQHDSTLPYAVAGQGLQSVLPRGVIARGGLMAYAPHAIGSAIANPLSLLGAPALAAFSPRIVGNLVYAGGRAVGTVEDVANAMHLTPETLRALEQAGFQGGRNNALNSVSP